MTTSDINIIYDQIFISNPRVLKEFQEMGISIALDDYGTGHNSLSYLLEDRFTFDFIKIDKVFIDEIGKNPNENVHEQL